MQISKTAETKHNHYFYQRQQSRMMAERRWESRLASPALGYGVEVLRALGIALAGVGFLVALLAVHP